MKRMLRQTWRLLRESPVLSIVGILGTALAIGMLMMSVMKERVRTAPFYPSVHRDRYLYIKTMNSYDEEQGIGTGSNSHCNPNYLKEFEGLEHVVAEAIYTNSGPKVVSVAGEKSFETVDYKGVNADYWKVFEFEFVEGQPFAEAEVEAGMPIAVVSQSLARRLFGEKSAVGQQIEVSFKLVTICGVVRDASSYVYEGYAKLYMPYTCMAEMEWDPHCGTANACFLVDSRRNMESVRAQIIARNEQHNAAMKGTGSRLANLRGQPDDQLTVSYRVWSNEAPDVQGAMRHFYVKMLIILLVPAVNLMAVASARMRRRYVELGVRKTYGARPWQLMWQMFSESLVQTICGGMLGLGLALAGAYALRATFFNSYALESMYSAALYDKLPLGVIFSIREFGLVLLFSFVLNVLSVLLPSWWISRRPIVESLNTRK